MSVPCFCMYEAFHCSSQSVKTRSTPAVTWSASDAWSRSAKGYPSDPPTPNRGPNLHHQVHLIQMWRCWDLDGIGVSGEWVNSIERTHANLLQVALASSFCFSKWGAVWETYEGCTNSRRSSLHSYKYWRWWHFLRFFSSKSRSPLHNCAQSNIGSEIIWVVIMCFLNHFTFTKKTY